MGDCVVAFLMKKKEALYTVLYTKEIDSKLSFEFCELVKKIEFF